MASIAALSLKDPVLPLQQATSYDEIIFVKIRHYYDDNGTERYREAKLPFCPDISDKELLVHVVHNFLVNCENERLHIHLAADRYSRFGEVVGGELRMTWNAISAARTVKDDASFLADLADFVSRYFRSTAFHDQAAFLNNAKKPFKMTCPELAGRLRVLNQYGRYLPGNGGAASLFDENALKRVFYGMMLDEWKLQFALLGQRLDDPAYTFKHLTDFMSLQEEIYNAKSNKRKSPHHPSQGDRGGRGGRHGRGRGYGGRGRGRSNNGGYLTGYSSGRGYGGYNGYGSYGRAPYTPRYQQGQYGGAQPITPGTSGSGGSHGGSSSQGRGGYSSPGGRGNGGGNGNGGRGRYGFMHNRGRGPTPYVPTFYGDSNRAPPVLPPPPIGVPMPPHGNDHYYQDPRGYEHQDQYYSGEATEGYHQGGHPQDMYLSDLNAFGEDPNGEPYYQQGETGDHWMEGFDY